MRTHDLLKPVSICCIFLSIISFPLFAQNDKERFDSAYKLWEEGNYRAAIPLANAYLAKYPMDDWGHQLLIFSYLDSVGIQPLLDSLYGHPKSLATRYGRAFVLFKAGRLTESKKLAEQLYNAGYKTYLLLNLLGNLERLNGNFRGSMKYINQALAIDDQHNAIDFNLDVTIDSLVLHDLRLFKNIPSPAFKKTLTTDLNAGKAKEKGVWIEIIPNCFGNQSRIIVFTTKGSEGTVRFYEESPGTAPKLVIKRSEGGTWYGEPVKVIGSAKKDLFYVSITANTGMHNSVGFLYTLTGTGTDFLDQINSQTDVAYYFEDLNHDGYPEVVSNGSEHYVLSYADGYVNVNCPILTYNKKTGISNFVLLAPEIDIDIPDDIQRLNTKAVCFAGMEYWYEAKMILDKIDQKWFSLSSQLEWNKVIIDFHYRVLKKQHEIGKNFLSAALLGKRSVFTEFPNIRQYPLGKLKSTETLSRIFNTLLLTSSQLKNNTADKLVLNCADEIYEAIQQHIEPSWGDTSRDIKLSPELSLCQPALLGMKQQRVIYLENELTPDNFRKLYSSKNFTSTITSGQFSNLTDAYNQQFKLLLSQGVINDWFDEKYFRDGIASKNYNSVWGIIQRYVKTGDIGKLRNWFNKYVAANLIFDPAFAPFYHYYKASEQLYIGKYYELIQQLPVYETIFSSDIFTSFYTAYERVGLDDLAYEHYLKTFQNLKKKGRDGTMDEFLTQIRCLSGLGRTLLRQNKPVEAKYYFLKYLQIARAGLFNAPTYPEYANVLLWLSKTYAALGEIDKATCYNELAFYYSLRSNPPEFWSATAFRFDYQFLVEYYLQKYKLAKALGETGLALGYLNASLSIINDLYKTAGNEFDKMRFSEVGKPVFEYAIIENVNQHHLFDAFVLSSAIKDKTIAQQELFKDSLRLSRNSYQLAYQYLQSAGSNNLVHYEVMENQLLIFYRQNGKIAVHRDTTIGRQALEEKVNFYLDRLQGLGYRQQLCDSLSHELYNKLIAPIAGSFTDSVSLAIRPDGILYNLPFAALFDGQHYLTEKYALQYPSISFQTDHRPWILKNGATALLGSKSNFYDLMQLTHTENELDSISHMLNRHGVASIHLKDEKFTSGNIFENMADNALIHLSTHTLIDEFIPMNSSITAEGEGKGSKDTAISLSSFFNKNPVFTKQPLVILSSCKSSGGQLTEEGMVGFGKLFIMRGAKNVVGSICEVADAATATFFSRFYYYLIERHYDAVNALHQTQVDLIAAGAPPANWSSFIIHTK